MTHFFNEHSADLKELTAWLLDDPEVDECVVLERGTDMVAYVVLSAPRDGERTAQRLREWAAGRIAAVVPLARLPLDGDGVVDHVALAGLPIRSEDSAQAWERQVADLPDIDRVACVSAYAESTPRHLHIAEVLRIAAPTSHPLGDRAAADNPLPAPEIARPEAIRHGGPIPEIAGSARVLSELLLAAARDTAIIFIDAEGGERVESYGFLLDEAQRLLGGLRQRGLKPGAQVLLQLERNDDILPAFWACVLGGFAPTITAVPLAYEVASRALDHLRHLWTLFEQPLIITTRARCSGVLAVLGTDAEVAVIDTLREHAPDSAIYQAAPDDVAFYTLSSGSTGLPKAVPLTHRNLLLRARGANAQYGHSADDVVLNWLPFDHIGSISDLHIRRLEPASTLVYVAKDYILARPLRWLELLHRYRVTHSWAPNFAYALVNTALRSEQRRDFDLSCVRVLLSAGESVTRAATREFLDHLAPCGLAPSALQTAFGMAEVCSGTHYHAPLAGQSLRFQAVDRDSLGGALRLVGADDPEAVALASLGPIIPGLSMRIVDSAGRVVPEAVTGRLHLKGAALTSGYYQNPEANRVFLAEGWFDTGDSGFILDGELYLIGRAETGLIINGANFYNSEIEAVVEQVAGVDTSYTAACAVRPSGSEAEKLAVFFHAACDDDAFLLKLLKAIQSRLTKQLGIKADFLIPISRAELPKTAIGKIQHKQLVAQFHQGAFRDILQRLDILTGNEHTLPDRFHRPVWQRKQRVHAPRPVQGSCLIFLDSQGVGASIAAQLADLGMTCLTVTAGDSYAQLDATAWTLRPDESQDYRELAISLRAAGIRPEVILYLFDEVDGLLAFAHTLDTSTPVKLFAVARQAHSAIAGEEPGYDRAALPGVLRILERDVTGLRCVHVDIATTAPAAAATELVQELLTPAADRDIAFRDDQRWVAGLARVEFSATLPELPFRRQGVYILGGPLGSLGTLLAEFLLDRYQARLLILDSASSHLASETCVHRPMTAPQAIAATLAEWGNRLDGVIYLAPTHTDPSPDGLSAHLEAEYLCLQALKQLLADYRGERFISLTPAAGFPGDHEDAGLAARAACHAAWAARLERTIPTHSLGLAFWAESWDGQEAALRRAFTALLVGLRLGPGRFLVGLDGNHPEVRARCYADSPELLNTTVYFTARRPVPVAALRELALVDGYGSPAHCAFVPLREPEAAGSEQVELWPSVAEYFVYDELIYYALANDERRNRSYRVALDRAVPGKIVLDIGTGKEAILARLALESGARKVYAIEKGEEAYHQAVARVRQLGLDDRIFILHGDANEVELPEPADVCVSEIVGPIGGCEGAAVLINNAHRFLKPGGLMIPGRSVTKIAAARFPDELMPRLGFYKVPGSYTGKIFAEVGYPFDLRVCIKKFPRGNLLSNADIFEDLDFNRPITLEDSHDIELVIDQASRFDGFLVWLNLHTIEGEVIDILAHEYSWLPVYLPVFDPGVEVLPGDRVVATINRTLCENRLNPDFVITGQVRRQTGETLDFTCASYHFRERYQQHGFYQRLFADDPMGLNPGCRPGDILQHLDEMPLTPTGAVDRERLKSRITRRDAGKPQTALSGIELQIAEVWREVLEVPEVGVHDSFFELGGHSLLLVRVLDRLVELFGPRLTLVDLFKYPTIHALVQVLADDGPRETAAQQGQKQAEARSRLLSASSPRDIAVIGMACRFPGADDPETFWRNLLGGVESITFFEPRDIAASGIDPVSAQHPDYVRASPTLRDVEGFDAEFFGYSARDVELMDPQHRLFLEVSWEAFENAGYEPTSYPGVVGVYAGASMNTYLFNNVLPNRASLDPQDSLEVATLDSMGGFQLMVASDKDYLTTRVSYKLNLRGTSVNVQTACSTGLVVIHMACQALLAGEADMFLAGGSSVQAPQQAGHLYQNGMIVSPDGHCRAFDAEARGTIFGSGVGAVLLKRLEDAVRDGDHIYAVIKGSAVNNDGGVKVGYMAPSGDGEASVAAEALAMAGVSADSIGFVEAHGTGTELGDPIEVNALSQAFRTHTDRKSYCAIGSVKTNVGHLQIASGSVGFMKAALALHHRAIPPTLHFRAPNPAIDFANSPFYVNTQAVDWPTNDTPRRAGVNSLGIGGTNCHVILEEAPARAPVVNARERPRHVLQLSARCESALTALAGRYADYLGDHPEVSLADLCFTANTGRKPFAQRLAVVAESAAELRAGLAAYAQGEAPERGARGHWNGQSRPKIAFLFTGQGSQYAAMGRELYDTQPGFRRDLDACAAILRPLMDRPLLDVLYPAEGVETPLDDTAYAQPALFALEYALARLWQSWGIEPDAVIGHSLGEYVAACVAGVFSLEDGLTLVAERARLMQALPREGSMAAVFVSEAELRPFLAAHAQSVAIAAENGPEHLVISGRTAVVQAIIEQLHSAGYKTQRLNTSHAFHSPLMEPMLAGFFRVAQGIGYAAPRIPVVSNLDGAWAGDDIATPDYWRRHIRQPVRFAAGLNTLVRQDFTAFIEIGPQPVLLGMAARGLPEGSGIWLPSLRQGGSDWAEILHSLARLAVVGPVDWRGFDQDYQRRRLPLPTYPFQRRRYWLDRPVTPRTVRLDSHLHPLLGHKLRLPAVSATVYENQFSTQDLPFLLDHRIHERVVVSGASHVAMLLAAAARHYGPTGYGIKNLYFPEPLFIPDHEARTVQVVLTPTHEREAAAQLLSFAETGAEPVPVIHAEGVVSAAPPSSHDTEAFETVWARCRDLIPVADFFRVQAERGIELGTSYRWFEELRRGEGETVCRLRPPESMGGLYTTLHPGLLDACFGLFLATGIFPDGETWLPFAIEAVHVRQEIGDLHLWGHLTLRPAEDGRRRIADMQLRDFSGQVLIEFVGFEARPAARALSGSTIDSLLYIREWHAAPVATTEQTAAGDWLILTDRQGCGADLAERLGMRGGRCVLVEHGADYAAVGPDRYRVNPARVEDSERLLRDSGAAYRGVVHLWSLDEPGIDAGSSQTLAALSLPPLVRALANAGSNARLWLVTRGGQPVGDEVLAIQQASLWGVGLSVALEHPELACTGVDLDPAATTAAELVTSLLAADDDERQIAWRQGVRHVARLVRRPAAVGGEKSSIRAEATYLITGGTGGLGLCIAEWLVAQGASQLVLVSRREPGPAAIETIQRLEHAGARVLVLQADVADREAIAGVFDRVRASLPPLRGVFHCAGLIADGLMVEQEPERFRRVFPPKLAGAWHLHELSQQPDLDYFVLFSSAASVLGNPGQANYAAANAFLDALAHYRRRLGLVATSLNWGPWDQVGIAVSDRVITDRMQRMGFIGLPPATALAALERVLAGDDIQTAIIAWDSGKYLAQSPIPRPDLAALATTIPVAPVAATPNLVRELAEANPDRRRVLLAQWVGESVRRILGTRDLDSAKPFTEQGLDSLMAVQLRNVIANGLQRSLPVSLAFNYPTVAEIVAYLDSLLAPEPAANPQPQNSAATAALDVLAELDQLLGHTD